MMDKLDDDQLEDIKKMSTARLKAKLLTAGYSDEDVESFDRQICMEKWAEQVTRGVDEPVPTSPQFTAYAVELERDRLRWEQQKYEMEEQKYEREQQKYEMNI